MIKKNQGAINALNMILDILLVFALLSLIPGERLPGIGVLSRALYSVGLWLMLYMIGFYNSDRMTSMRTRMAKLIISCVIAAAALATLRFLGQRGYSSTQTYGWLFAASSSVLVSKYILMRLFLRGIRRLGMNRKHVLLVGSGPLARQFLADVERNPGEGFNLNGYYGQENPELHIPHLGSLSDLDISLRETTADAVVLALESEQAQLIRPLLQLCRENGLSCMIVPDYGDLLPVRSELTGIGHSSLLVLREGVLEYLGWAIVKRLMDILLSAVALVLLSPLMLAIAIGIKLSSPGPVLYRQQRVGYHRKLFTMLKFRSMRVNDTGDSAWSTAEDPRRTAFGAWLRKLSLDELPQLINVLTGSMSLVGPRPELPVYVEEFREQIPLYMLKHQVRPGITGWAQVNGLRGDTSIEERIRYDFWYIEHWSLWLDIQILLRTVFGAAINDETLSSRDFRLITRMGDYCFGFPPLAQALYLLCKSAFRFPEWDNGFMYVTTVFFLLSCTTWWFVRLLHAKRSVRLGGWLLLCNALWVLLSRLCLGVSVRQMIFSSRWYFLFFCCFGCCAMTDREQRRKIGSILTALLGGLLLIWGLVGLWAAWTGVYVQNEVFFNSGIGMYLESSNPPLVYLRLLDTHRNTTAFYYVMGIGLMLWQRSRSEKRIWRWAAGICVPVYVLILALQHSRSSWVAGGMVLALSMGFAVQKRLAHRWVRNLALIAVAMAGTVVIFACFNPLSNTFARLAQTAQSAAQARLPEFSETVAEPGDDVPALPEAEENLQAEDAAEEDIQVLPPSQELAVDDRNTLEDVKTLTLRTGIWQALFTAMEEKHVIALLGQSEMDGMEIINAQLPYPVYHMHNMFFQQLNFFGMPSFLLCIAFVAWIAWGILRTMLLDPCSPQEPLGAVCGAAMLYGMVEPMMSRFTPFSSVAFMLLCGCFAGEWNTAGKRGRENRI